MSQTQTQLYVVTYGNQDGETITRGPVSAIGALEIADDMAGYIPSWSGISFFIAGDYDGKTIVNRAYLEALVNEPRRTRADEPRRTRDARGFVAPTDREIRTAGQYANGGIEFRESALGVESVTATLLIAINSAEYENTREFLSLASFRIIPVDKWGNTLIATVFYSTDSEYITQWGGRDDGTDIEWTCYAD